MELIFKPYPGNPLREVNERHPARVGFRCIVFNGVYHIFEEGITGGRWRIYKRTSLDGISLGARSTTLFPFGEKGSFDELGQADPAVIYNGTWRMWFDAMNGGTHWDKIGYATSPDGDNWTIQRTILERGLNKEWDCQSVHHPVCIEHEGTYYLYYSGCDGSNIYNVKSIGLATSKDGEAWVKEKTNPVILNGKDNEWDCKYVRPSVPVFIDDRWFMFYWGFNGKIHSMGVAESFDLVKWDKLGRFLSGTNNHNGITASQILKEGSKIRMWYKMFNCWNLNTGEIELI